MTKTASKNPTGKRFFLLLMVFFAFAVQVTRGATTFSTGSLIIPMDEAKQNYGMWKAYGLVYNLLKNGVPVQWAINPSKAWNGTDFTATTRDLRTQPSPASYNFSGGPFIVDAAYATQAQALITAWWSKNGNLPNVEQATASFTANIDIVMDGPPRIANEAINAGITIAYYNAAGIPDLNGNPWTTASPNIVDQTAIANGLLFTNGPDSERKFDIFVTPHNGGYSYSLTDPTNLGTKTYAQLDHFVYQGGGWMACCHSIISNENAIADLYKNGSSSVRALFKSTVGGGFLTYNGIPSVANTGGTWTVNKPGYPLAQAVATSGASQTLPGGSIQTWARSGVSYFSQTEKVAYFNNSGTIYDWALNGVYHGGAGSGKMACVGGHSFSTALPYSTNYEAPYLRFFFNTIFFNGKGVPKVTLINTPASIPQGQTSDVTLKITNSGASIATNTNNVTITLAAGVSYIGTTSGPAPTQNGSVLSWGTTLGNIARNSTAAEITVRLTPATTGNVTLGTLSANFGDLYGETFYSKLNRVVTVTPAPVPVVSKSASPSSLYAGQVATYTILYRNSGTVALLNSKVEDLLPAGFTYKSATPTPSSITISGGRTLVRWYRGTLPASGSDQTITLTAYTAGTSGSSYTNDVTLTGTDSYSNSFNSSGSASVLIVEPLITLTKAVSPTGGQDFGTTLSYTLSPSFSSTDLLNNLLICDPVPAYTTYVTSSVSTGGSYGFTPLAKVDGYDDAAGSGTTNNALSVPTPTIVTEGGTVTVTMTLTNNSGSSITGIVPSIVERYNGATFSAPSQTGFDLANGANTSVTWTATMSSIGERLFQGSADGTLSGNSYSFATSTSNTLLVPSFINASPSNDITTWRIGSNSAKSTGSTLISGIPASVYALRGNSSTNFSRYEMSSTPAWASLTAISGSVGSGGSLTTDGNGKIYALQGGGSQNFYVYTITPQGWAALATTGTNVSDGGALVYLNGYVYALMGSGTTFKRYNISSTSWETLASLTNSVGQGGSLTTDGTYIYALEGNNQKRFWRYSITGNSWTAMANAPGAVKQGGSLTRIGNYIYALRGNISTNFYRYTISTNTWATRTNVPKKVANGGSLTTDGTNVYALIGNNTAIFYRFNTSTNTWTALTSATFGNVAAGGSVVFHTSSNPQGLYTEMTVNKSLVTTGQEIKVTMAYRSELALTNVTPSSFTITSFNGAASPTLISGPTLLSADANITSITDTVKFQWVYTTGSAGTLPGSALTFAAGGTATGTTSPFPTATTQSVLVSPVLNYQATIKNASSVPAETKQVTNFAMISDNLKLPNGIESNRTSTLLNRPQLFLTTMNSPTGTVTPGDEITYSITVTNDGPGTATNVVISDPIPGYTTYVTGSASMTPSSGPSPLVFNLGSIPQGTSQTVTFRVSANSGLAAGSYTISNASSATADNVPNATITSETVTNTLNVAASFTVTNVPDVEAITAAGNLINYTITVVNTGDVALSAIHITDALLPSLAGPDGDYGTTGTLDIGESWTYRATYTVPQSDIDNNGGGDGMIDNTASVYFDNLMTPVAATSTVAIALLEVTNTASPDLFALPGTVTYSYTIRNNGSTTLNNLTLNDNLLGSITLGTTTLAPGATTTATATYTITQAMIDAGTPIVTNATATGKFTPSGGGSQVTVSGSSTETVNITHEPYYTLTNTQTGGPSPVTTAGQVVTYQVVLTNAGNSSITGISGTPTYPGSGAHTLSGPVESLSTNSVLNVGENWIYTITYTVTQEEICAGVPLNTAFTVTTTEDPGPKMSTATTPVTVPTPPTVDAGTAVSTCSTSGAVNVTTGATASNHTGVNWTSSGTGSWTNQTSLTEAAYTPSAADITAGSVTLTLVATGPCTNDTATKSLTILATPTSDFSADLLTPPRNTTVTFTNSSTNSTSWEWSFSRDTTVAYTGGTSATHQNPQVQFTEGGPYTVTLVAHNAGCSVSITKTEYIWAGIAGLWYGKYTTEWNKKENWDNWIIPADTYFVDVVIPTAASFWPVYDTGDLTVGSAGNGYKCKSITLQGINSKLTVSGGKLIINP